MPELNRWLQIVVMERSVSRFSAPYFVSLSHGNIQFQVRLTATMIIDFIGCWAIEKVCKYLFADLEPKPMITRGRERREQRRRLEEEAMAAAALAEAAAEEKKSQ